MFSQTAPLGVSIGRFQDQNIYSVESAKNKLDTLIGELNKPQIDRMPSCNQCKTNHHRPCKWKTIAYFNYKQMEYLAQDCKKTLNALNNHTTKHYIN